MWHGIMPGIINPLHFLHFHNVYLCVAWFRTSIRGKLLLLWKDYPSSYHFSLLLHLCVALLYSLLKNPFPSFRYWPFYAAVQIVVLFTRLKCLSALIFACCKDGSGSHSYMRLVWTTTALVGVRSTDLFIRKLISCPPAPPRGPH